MDELRDRLKMLKLVRWRAALAADGSDGDAATDRLIRLQRAIVAIEAALAEGAPDGAAPMDLAGYELAQTAHPLAPAEPDGIVRSRLFGAAAGGGRSNGAAGAVGPSKGAATPGGFLRRGVSIRYAPAHPWFGAWQRAVQRGGYRLRWRPGA